MELLRERYVPFAPPRREDGLRNAQTLPGMVTDSVSSLLIRGSLTASTEEREACASGLLKLGDSASARIAFRRGLQAAAGESIDMRQMASALSRAAHGRPVDSLFSACIDCISGDYLASRAAGEIGAALARSLGPDKARAAVADCMRLLGSESSSDRKAAAGILLALCRHPATDTARIASEASDYANAEASSLIAKASALPPKIIDIPASALAVSRL